MRKRISALLLVLAMVVTSFLSPLTVEAAYGKVSSYKDYKVYTPAGYNRFDESRQYPVIYVMPQNGYKMDNSGLVKKLQSAMKNGECTQMIIVTPEFSKWTDIHAAMESLVEKIDARYNTLEGAEYRAVVGTGVGGYLAYIAGITEKYVEPEEVPPVEDEPVEDEPVVDEPVVDEPVEDAVVEEVVEEKAAPAEEVEEEAAPAEEVVEEEAAPAEEVVEEEAVPEEECLEEEATPEYVAADAPNLFKYVASIRGNFVGKGNYWRAKYGEVYDYFTTMSDEAHAGFFLYMDTPVKDAWADMEGSTNDLGNAGIGKGLLDTEYEYTARLGSFEDDFFTESVCRVARRFTDGILADKVSGTVALKQTVLPSDATSFEVDYTVDTTEALADFSAEPVEMEITVKVLEPSTDEVLAYVSTTAETGAIAAGTLELEKNITGTSATVVLSVELLGTEFELANATALNVRETVVDGDYQLLDLMGDWNFHYLSRGYAGNGPQGYDVVKEDIETGAYKEWDVVQPGLAWWTEGFGDLVSIAAGDYGFLGEGWYVREFEVPVNFDAPELYLSIGNLDDRGQAYINGVLVGETGMNGGVPNGESAWEEYSYYKLDPSILNIGGTNKIVVRCYNDTWGGGGWYSGPTAIYSKSAFEADESTASYFTEYSFDSKYAASALGSEEETVKNKYLVALPESYDENPDKYYPTVYLMHQYNSTHKSYITDDIDRLMRNAAKEGLLDEMIIVVPNSQEESWWRGDWMKMVSDELVPLIDSTYRTIDDARYRFTAGCSMGGQGAYGVALQNPELFSGAVSFFGAFSMGGDASPNTIAENESAEYLDYYTMYFICGNQDLYKFGQPAIQLHQQLLDKDVDHEFFIENGGHDSPFYVPHFVDAMIYTRNNMYHSDGTVGDYLAADAAIDAEAGKVTVSFEALDGIENYYNNIPDSSYTEDNTPALSVPLKVEVEQDGKVVLCEVVRDNFVEDGKLAGEFTFDLPEGFDAEAEYTVTVKAFVFDGVYELYSKTNAPEVDDPEVDDPDVDDPDDDDKPGTDKPEKPEKPSNPVINIMTKMMKTFVNIFKGFFGKLWK